MTLGERRIRPDWNPTGDATVADLKQRAADFIDAVDRIKIGGEEPGEIARLKALAMTDIESASSWATKAAAKSAAG